MTKEEYIQMAVQRAIQMYTDKKISYVCSLCGKEFVYEDFAVLGALNGFLVCDECYTKESEKELSVKPSCGGYLVNLIDTNGINRYAFSHGATFTIRAVAYNSKLGYFLVKQEFCDCGCGYRIMQIPNNYVFGEIKSLLDFEETNKHLYGEMNYGQFHPFLLFVQFKDISEPDDVMIAKLKKSPLRNA